MLTALAIIGICAIIYWQKVQLEEDDIMLIHQASEEAGMHIRFIMHQSDPEYISVAYKCAHESFTHYKDKIPTKVYKKHQSCIAEAYLTKLSPFQ